MVTIEEQILAVEKEIRETPYNKSTEHHIGKLRAKISRLKDRALDAQTRSSGGGGGYAVKKQGDATVVLVGPPSAGKSTLLNALTNAESKVAPYAFTTVSVVPGMMKYNDAYIQILDVPGLIEGAEAGKGRGREVLSVVRGSDLLIFLSDVDRPEAVARIRAALEKNGIRVDQQRPDVSVDKKLSGGVGIKTNLHLAFSRETVREIAWEMGVKNAEISIRERVTLEQLIDVFSKNRVYIPSITVLNKADTVTSQPLPDALYVSAEKEEGLEVLRELIWEKLKLVKIYLVKLDEKPSANNPFIAKEGDALKKVLETLGTEMAELKTKAQIWGTGAKFPGQKVSLSTKVKEGMMVRFI